MKLTNNIEQLIRKNRYKATPETYGKTLRSFMQAVDECNEQAPNNMKSNIWRIIMCKPITKLSIAAIVIVAICASIPLLDNGGKSVYAIDQTIAAIQTIRTLHMRVTGYESDTIEYNYLECWIKCDDTGRLTNFRVNIYRSDLDEDVEYLACSVWNDGVVKAWIPSENSVIIYRDEEDGEMEDLLEVIDPNCMQQRLHDASQNKEQYDMTIDDSAHEDFIYVEVLDHNDNTRIELLVDPKTKLVSQLDAYDLDKQEDEPSTRIEFLAYNQPIDPELFELSEIPDDARVIDQVHEPVGVKEEDMSNHEVAVEVMRQLAERIAQLDIDQADRAAVESLFGEPLEYVWGGQTFSEGQLCGNYILNYPCDFSVWMQDDRIMEIRFGDQCKYTCALGVAIGASVPEVLAVLGDPVATVIGQKNEFRDRVLYRDIKGRHGHCYYHCSDQQIRLWFSNNKVCAIYMTRTDFPVH
jgi:hypothetical protein